jgi:RNA recognition motif. (a.k.a. RRM, RBD, or RNP domain)
MRRGVCMMHNLKQKCNVHVHLCLSTKQKKVWWWYEMLKEGELSEKKFLVNALVIAHSIFRKVCCLGKKVLSRREIYNWSLQVVNKALYSTIMSKLMIRVDNIPNTVSPFEILSFFSSFGHVKRIQFPIDQSYSTAIVTFAQTRDHKACLKMKETQFGDHKVQLKIHKIQKHHEE